VPDTAVPHPSATVVLTRDGDDGLEVLLVQRNAALAFHGGAWVFPGGRVDAADRRPGDDELAAARRAAAREAREEVALTVDADGLVPFSRWTTPEPMPKRFTTWFFAGVAEPGEVAVDGGEIHDHRWLAPAAALGAQRRDELELPPPTFVTLLTLTPHPDTATLLRALAARAPEDFTPRITAVPGGGLCLYHGDVAYDGGDPDRPGPRHRLSMLEDGWRYERG
jgi:8-oxo-dGTP pyrophosphatase MutT (NUDIX family)